jgi:hypothetical protein
MRMFICRTTPTFRVPAHGSVVLVYGRLTIATSGKVVPPRVRAAGMDVHHDRARAGSTDGGWMVAAAQANLACARRATL